MATIVRFFAYCVLMMILLGCDNGGDDAGVDDKSCTGSNPLECESNEFCRFPDGTCGANHELGTCVEIPEVCSAELASVCACDGITYRNACAAISGGISIFAYQSCASLVQLEGRLCGGPSSVSCAQGLFCDFVDGSCGVGGTFGICTQIQFNCNVTPSYVCGCDGVTYQNKCFAQAGAMSIQSTGVCS